jgi:ATP-dependent helicase STH1/SNF2
MSNWVNEFAKWSPDLMVVDYKGSKLVRRDLRRKLYSTGTLTSSFETENIVGDGVDGSVNGTNKTHHHNHHHNHHPRPSFHVLLTTYEYAIRDKSQLKRFPWEYIIVDEGHRGKQSIEPLKITLCSYVCAFVYGLLIAVKNADSLLSRTLAAQYHSKSRLLLTGTPLQNNLPELWALLNFLLPTIFSSAESFEEWFSKPFDKFRQRGAVSERDPLNEKTSENSR